MLELISRLLSRARTIQPWPNRENQITFSIDREPTDEEYQPQNEPNNNPQLEKPVAEDDARQDHPGERVVVLDDPKLGQRVFRVTEISLRLR